MKTGHDKLPISVVFELKITHFLYVSFISVVCEQDEKFAMGREICGTGLVGSSALKEKVEVESSFSEMKTIAMLIAIPIVTARIFVYIFNVSSYHKWYINC